MDQSKSPFAPDGPARRWVTATLAAALAFGLMAYGLSLRPAYVSSATVRIGGVLDSGVGGNPHFTAFDAANELEYFYSNEVFPKLPEVATRCSVSSRYSPDGGRVDLGCKAATEEQVRALTEVALKPLMDRHERQYSVAMAVETHRKALLELQSKGFQQTLDTLQQAPASPLTKVQIIEHQLRLEAFRERLILDRMLGERVTRTRLDGSGVSVSDRRPTARTWAIVAALSLFAGLFIAAFPWLLKRLGHEPLRNDA